MKVDFLALLNECQRLRVLPDPYSSLNVAHSLLEQLQPFPGTCLEWANAREWQLSIGGKVVHTGSFEDCVTALAARRTP